MIKSEDGITFQDDFVGTYIGGDQIIAISGYTGEQLSRILSELRAMLATGKAVMQANLTRQRLVVTAPDSPPITLSEEAAKALLPVADEMAEEDSYLAALVVQPRYGRWATQFVSLAGMLSEWVRPVGWQDVPPEFMLLEMQKGDQPNIIRRELEDINEVFKKYSAVTLLGEPGSGKSTTLYKLALDAAQSRLETSNGKLPLLLELNNFRGFKDPFDFVQNAYRKRLGANPSLTDRLRKRELLLLFDALNEMPYADMLEYRSKVHALRKFCEEWPGNIAVFTCRSRDYGEPLGYNQVEILQMTDPRVKEFLGKYLSTDQAAEAWRRLEGAPLLELLRNPYYLNMFAYLVAREGAWPESRAGLFRNFIALLLQREKIKYPLKCPDADDLLAVFTELAARMQPLGEGTRLPRSQVLQYIAADAHLDGRKVSLDPEETVKIGLSATLLDTERGEEEENIKFYHHQLQEFFAARRLLEQLAVGEGMQAYWLQPHSKQAMPAHGELGPAEPLPGPPTTGWEEPTTLAAGLAEDPGAFIRNVMAINPVLAARCLAEPGLPKLEEERAVVQRALLAQMSTATNHVRARLAAGDALGLLGDPRFREVDLDGTRLLLPPLIEVEGGAFKMGSGRLQVFNLARRGFQVNDELPRHKVNLTSFWMGQFPVTNAEYRCFVNDGGYTDEMYWPTVAARAWRRGEDLDETAESEIMRFWRALQGNPEKILAALRRQGRSPEEIEAFAQVSRLSEEDALKLVGKYYGERDRTSPAFWNDPRFLQDTQPVVGLTWYEALAYCSWLSDKLKNPAPVKELGLPDGEWLARLPSEAEWEYAARGRKSREYPWGRGFENDQANTYEGRVLRPSPVGVYPDGVSPQGIHDLSGSVWEWTASLYRPYPFDPEKANDLDATGPRVVRGGSWSNNGWHARSAYRYRGSPSFFDCNIGFRVVLSLALPGS